MNVEENSSGIDSSGVENDIVSEVEENNVAPSVDIADCDREPIHIPGFIQPHGMLLALNEGDLTITQASANTLPHMGRTARELNSVHISEILDEMSLFALYAALDGDHISQKPLQIFSTHLGDDDFHVLAHRYDGVLILEWERAVLSTISSHNLYAMVSSAVARLESAPDSDELCRIAATEMRRLTGLDKVMIYLFDSSWNGTVVAESKAEEMESYLHLRFPASDIPRQARDLYLLNKLRLIADVHATPVPVVPNPNPQTERALNMTYSTLRSVSPIHIEYLKNMGVGASMSVSIARENELTGLFACHHRTAKYLSHEVRTACEFLGQVLALQLAALQRNADRERRLRAAQINAFLLEKMSHSENYINALQEYQNELLSLTDAEGAALCKGNTCVLVGKTPTKSAVIRIAQWLKDQKSEVVATRELNKSMENAPDTKSACGVLAISTSVLHGNFIIWFRPEITHTVNWAGNPSKSVTQVAAAEEGKAAHLHPRQSFEVWKETVRGHSAAWCELEVNAAGKLREAIVEIVLRQAEERAQLSTQLEHSNQELESFSYSVSHDLRAPFRHITGFANLLRKYLGDSLDETGTRYLNTISESAEYGGTLVDNVLAFSRMGRAEMRMGRLDMAQLVQETRASFDEENTNHEIEWNIGPLPVIHGDLQMIRLAIQNLFSNAVKYSRNRERTVITMSCVETEEEWIFAVEDNGVGFDMQYVNKLFGVFQRLHRAEEYEGTGIGLANTRRIVERHGGRIWAESQIDGGAKFSFALPKQPLQMQSGERKSEESNGEELKSWTTSEEL